jgi:hypothetical protein
MSKLQTHTLIREGAPEHEMSDINRKIWLWAPDEGLTPRRTGQFTIGRKKLERELEQ